jgi:hypothetical protein
VPSKKAAADDEIPVFLVKRFAQLVAPPLADIEIFIKHFRVLHVFPLADIINYFF